MATKFDLSYLRAPGARRRMALLAAVGGAIGAAYGLLSPRWYTSSVTLVAASMPRPGLGGIGAMLGGDLGGIASGLTGGGGGTATVQRIAAVLQSAAVSDGVIEKFSLRERYGQKSQEGARETLWKHCDVKVLPKPSLVHLSCEDQDPKLAQAMLVYFAETGNAAFRRVGEGTASEEVRYLERRVTDLRAQADQAAQKVRDFQEKHGIVDLESQARAVVSSLATVQAQRTAKQLELDYARTYSSDDEATTRQLESQLSVMAERTRLMEEKEMPASGPGPLPGPKGKSRGIFPRAMEVPALRAEFEKLYRDRRVSEATLIFALERLESARADAARDVSTFTVLDPPILPTRKSRPSGLLSLVVGGALGLLAGAAWEWWRASGRALLSGGAD